MKNSFIALLSVLILSACGNNNDDNGGLFGQQQGVGVPPPQGYCAPEVIDAYNNFTIRCNTIASDLDVQACRFTAEHFLRNYEGISCVAVPPSGNGFGGQWGNNQYFGQFQGQQIFHITDFPMQNVLASLGQFNGRDPQWQRRHKRWPQVGHRGRF